MAGSGIGRALCVSLCSRGVNVIGCGRTQSTLDKTFEMCSHGAAKEWKGVFLSADVSQQKDRSKIVHALPNDAALKYAAILL